MSAGHGLRFVKNRERSTTASCACGWQSIPLAELFALRVGRDHAAGKDVGAYTLRRGAPHSTVATPGVDDCDGCEARPATKVVAIVTGRDRHSIELCDVCAELAVQTHGRDETAWSHVARVEAIGVAR